MQVAVESLLTHYQRTGSGKTLVLLHGWGDSAQGFAPLIHLLAPHYDVIAPDLPGFGQTSPPTAVWGLREYGEFVGRFLRKLEATPYAVVGHSNGGAIAIRGLTEQLFASEKLVLLASAGVRNQYKGRVKAIRYVTKAGKALTTPLPKSVKKRLRQKVYSTVGSDMLVAEHLQESFKRVVTDDVQAEAATLRLPTLLVYGDKDVSTPLEHGQKLHAAIAGSELEVIPDAGHFLTIENTARVASLIEEFVQ